ncbi:MAG TPA: 2-C-methyl-D-erythritol 4-phosphate cytidylyltransferase [Solirubrobacteraceae bacterium]|nr:2-C-methyl-D-erythritol 4-phosphate cytidylyltransferase [Solirubrobacteraceae bacterium]
MALALILAAGRGERLGAARPKALVELGGRALMDWSIDVLARVPAIERIVLALPPGVEAPALGASPAGGITKLASAGGAPEPAAAGRLAEVIGVQGGAARSQSVRRALAAAGPGDPVLIHDAARPLLTAELVERVLAALDDAGVDAAIAAAPVTDTIKRAHPDGTVAETLERSSLWGVQTPQVFRRAALERALDAPDEVLATATDDAWLIERAGGTVRLVDAPRENLKVTTELDLRVAELLLSQRASQARA